MKHCMFLFTIFVLYGCFGTDPQKSGKEGKPMPDFSLLSTDSITWIYSRDIPKGKPTVILYFSPYCPYCKSLTQKITDEIDIMKDIQFYFISFYTISEIKTYSKEFQLAKYPNVITAFDSAATLHTYFEIPGFPYTAVYSKDKILNKIFLGKMNMANLINAAEN